MLLLGIGVFLDLRPEENGALTEGTASHSTGHRVKRFDYLFRFSKDPNVTAAKMRPAALSASVRTWRETHLRCGRYCSAPSPTLPRTAWPKQPPAIAPYGRR